MLAAITITSSTSGAGCLGVYGPRQLSVYPQWIRAAAGSALPLLGQGAMVKALTDNGTYPRSKQASERAGQVSLPKTARNQTTKARPGRRGIKLGSCTISLGFQSGYTGTGITEPFGYKPASLNGWMCACRRPSGSNATASSRESWLRHADRQKDRQTAAIWPAILGRRES